MPDRAPGQPSNPWCGGGYLEPVEGYYGVSAHDPAGVGKGNVGTCPRCGQVFGTLPRSGAIPEHELRRGE